MGDVTVPLATADSWTAGKDRELRGRSTDQRLSLLAEIDPLTAGMPKEFEKRSVTNRTDQRANAVAESQILGDQGQSGG
jgi:hypothetical protein